MALLKCPECGKEISDKASFCQDCGYPIGKKCENSEKECVQETITTISENGKPESKTKNKKIIIGAIVGTVILISIIGGILLMKRSAEIKAEKARQEAEIKSVKEYNQYVDDFNSIHDMALAGVAESEQICVLVFNVWRNKIWSDTSEETAKYLVGAADFNKAVQNVYADIEIVNKLASIYAIQSEVENMLKQVQGYPEDFEKCYNQALELNSTLGAWVNLAKSPSGSLATYGDDQDQLVEAFVSEQKTFNAVLPEKKVIPDFDSEGIKKTEEKKSKDDKNDELKFADFMNQASSELPADLNYEHEEFGVVSGEAEINGVTGEVSYMLVKEGDKIDSVMWSKEGINEDEFNKILIGMKDKYGEPTQETEEHIQWSIEKNISVLMKKGESDIRIGWDNVG